MGVLIAQALYRAEANKNTSLSKVWKWAKKLEAWSRFELEYTALQAAA
jgi:hypothetical protein